jgi:hypothetical protein
MTQKKKLKSKAKVKASKLLAVKPHPEKPHTHLVLAEHEVENVPELPMEPLPDEPIEFAEPEAETKAEPAKELGGWAKWWKELWD